MDCADKTSNYLFYNDFNGVEANFRDRLQVLKPDMTHIAEMLLDRTYN